MASTTVVTGYIGKDPEVRDVNGRQVMKFSIADTESYRDRQSGDMKEDVTWYNIDVWGKPGSFESVINNKIIAKGNLMTIQGRIKTSPPREGQTGPGFWVLRPNSLFDCNLLMKAPQYRNQNGGQQAGGGQQQGGNFNPQGQQGNMPPQGAPQGNVPPQGSPQGNVPPQGAPQGNVPPQGGHQQQGQQGGYQQQGQQGGYQQQGGPQGHPQGNYGAPAPAGNMSDFDEEIPF